MEFDSFAIDEDGGSLVIAQQVVGRFAHFFAQARKDFLFADVGISDQQKLENIVVISRRR